MSKDMHIDWYTPGKTVSLPVGATIHMMRYWLEEGKKLGLEKVVMIAEIDPWMPIATDEIYQEVSQLVKELRILQTHLVSIDEYYANNRLPPIIDGLQDAVDHWDEIRGIMFG
jgi:hypothetical protein